MSREIYYENYLSAQDAIFNNTKLDILSYLKLEYGWFTLSSFSLISYPQEQFWSLFVLGCVCCMTPRIDTVLTFN